MRAFTLLELLIVIAIMAVLYALIASGLKAARRSANLAKEVNAARQLMGAYAAYSAANDGDLLPGVGNFPARDQKGNALGSPINSRYPWRLAPYFNYEMKILWGNMEDDQLSRLQDADPFTYNYRVSVEPSLGLNTLFVGGDYQSLDPTTPNAIKRYGQFCVTKMSQATRPSKLIVFASAGGSYTDGKLTGYYKVTAPYTTGRNWSGSWNEKLSADSFGNVDFRFDEKAVVAMLDGHVEVLNFKQLDDMRLWSNQAAEVDNPGFKLAR